MSTPANAMPDFDSQRITPAVLSPTRPLYWSIRRELWENRSIYLVPLGLAAVTLLGFLISAIRLPAKMRAASGLDPMQQLQAIEKPFTFAAMLIMAASFVVGIVYCLDALHGERRDRSILFWKSLPVSDLTTVLSKMSIPLGVIPVLYFVITLATQWIMLLLASAVLLASGQNAAILWTHIPWFQMSAMLLFHLFGVHAIWYAPLYAWLVLVSAWARRAAFLWAALPVAAIAIIEKIALNSTHFVAMLAHHFGGDQGGDFIASTRAMDPLSYLMLGRFLTSPGLWIGLAIAAVFVAAAVRLRRQQGPI
jgi:ABC-2 type transport system permease protein